MDPAQGHNGNNLHFTEGQTSACEQASSNTIHRLNVQDIPEEAPPSGSDLAMDGSPMNSRRNPGLMVPCTPSNPPLGALHSAHVAVAYSSVPTAQTARQTHPAAQRRAANMAAPCLSQANPFHSDSLNPGQPRGSLNPGLAGSHLAIAPSAAGVQPGGLVRQIPGSLGCDRGLAGTQVPTSGQRGEQWAGNSYLGVQPTSGQPDETASDAETVPTGDQLRLTIFNLQQQALTLRAMAITDPDGNSPGGPIPDKVVAVEEMMGQLAECLVALDNGNNMVMVPVDPGQRAMHTAARRGAAGTDRLSGSEGGAIHARSAPLRKMPLGDPPSACAAYPYSQALACGAGFATGHSTDLHNAGLLASRLTEPLLVSGDANHMSASLGHSGHLKRQQLHDSCEVLPESRDTSKRFNTGLDWTGSGPHYQHASGPPFMGDVVSGKIPTLARHSMNASSWGQGPQPPAVRPEDMDTPIDDIGGLTDESQPGTTNARQSSHEHALQQLAAARARATSVTAQLAFGVAVPSPRTVHLPSHAPSPGSMFTAGPSFGGAAGLGFWNGMGRSPGATATAPGAVAPGWVGPTDYHGLANDVAPPLAAWRMHVPVQPPPQPPAHLGLPQGMQQLLLQDPSSNLVATPDVVPGQTPASTTPGGRGVRPGSSTGGAQQDGPGIATANHGDSGAAALQRVSAGVGGGAEAEVSRLLNPLLDHKGLEHDQPVSSMQPLRTATNPLVPPTVPPPEARSTEENSTVDLELLAVLLAE